MSKPENGDLTFGSTDVSAVAVDLSPHPSVSYAVVWQGQLLPIRFATPKEATDHLEGLITRSEESHGD